MGRMRGGGVSGGGLRAAGVIVVETEMFNVLGRFTSNDTRHAA